jgi:endonuclease-3
MAEKQAEKVLEILRRTYTIPKWAASKNDPFETLIITIISQHTSDRNATKAFEMLSKQFEINPEALAKAEDGQIEDRLRVAGLYRNKAKAIRQVSRIVWKEFHGTLNPVLSLPLEEARNRLMAFPGVGPKTADIVLLFSAKKPTVPVDTHVNRVAKRLGFAPANGDYEAVRKSLQLIYDSTDYLAVHLLLIAHGRKYCKARRALCNQCPISMYCPSKGVVG